MMSNRFSCLIKSIIENFEHKNVIVSYPLVKTDVLGAQKNRGSFENSQHMFWLKNKKTNFQICTLRLSGDMCGHRYFSNEKI